WVLYMPPRHGVFLLGWILPLLVVAAGGWVTYRWLRARAGTRPQEPAGPQPGPGEEPPDSAGQGVDWQRELQRWM
ncbi:MAG TPA: hypothetical protein VIK92_06430, partial [Thermaerobacter sp.]